MSRPVQSISGADIFLFQQIVVGRKPWHILDPVTMAWHVQQVGSSYAYCICLVKRI